MKYQSILFQEKKVHFRTSGDGPAVVLLHGFLESLEIWEDFSSELQRDFKVISIDLPGHGFSENLCEIHGMDLMADVVYEVLMLNKINRCVMVGHSMGGYVTMAFASKYAPMLAGICLFHSGALADTDEAKANRDRTVEIVKKSHHHFISQFIPELFTPANREKFADRISELQAEARQTSPEAIIAALLGMKQRNSHLQTLLTCGCPVFFISGKQDPRIPIDKTLSQSALPAHAEVLLLDGCGHMGYIEAAETTLKALKFFSERMLY